MHKNIAIIGGGLAGCELAWQLARFDIPCTIFEMKPQKFSPAHKSPLLAELVCSNSLRSEELTTGIGLLKHEMEQLNSITLQAARACRVPAGKALAVDREKFSAFITNAIQARESIQVRIKEIQSLDDPELKEYDYIIIAAGPLISDPLAEELSKITGEDGKNLYFYDAIAPIVSADSINMEKVFWGARYAPDDKDYLNCPLTKEEYFRFYKELASAKTVAARDFEREIHFEGCLPVEAMAARGEMTLAYGPLKPVGLVDPRTGKQPFAVVQLRAENLDKTAFNLVGFQTKLTYPEQKRVFRLIPGLEEAEFLRLGSMHRNTYVNAPKVLTPELMLKKRPNVFLAGQITGVEGYLESAACGLYLGLHLAFKLRGKVLPALPKETALGALMNHLRTPAKKIQPSNIHFGLFPALNVRAKKAKRKELHARRAQEKFSQWLEEVR
jgi:methylenetetrahydrofolate--tRNA-(uracil-5-)-methyltransferase